MMYDPSEALLQLGLYDYVWGNPSLLQTYNANVQAQKARDEQAQYNMFWKDIENSKQEAAAEAGRRQELKEASVEMAKLNRELVNAKPQDAVIIRRQQAALVNKFPELKGSTADAFSARKEEEKYQDYKVKFIGKLPQTFATNDEIEATVKMVVENKELRPEDKEQIITSLRNKKSTSQMATEATQSAVASHAGKTTGEKLDEKAAKKKLADSARKKIADGRPERITNKEQKALDEGY
jgi:hypothetical protein